MGGLAKPGALSRLPKVLDLDLVDLRLGTVRALDGLKLAPAAALLPGNGDQFVHEIALPALPDHLLTIDHSSVAAHYTDAIADPSMLTLSHEEPAMTLRDRFDQAVASTLPWIHRLMPLAPYVAEFSTMLAAGITSFSTSAIGSLLPSFPIGIGMTGERDIQPSQLDQILKDAVHYMYRGRTLLTHEPPKPERLGEYLLPHASSANSLIKTHEHALAFFDREVVKMGYGSLETYIMRRFGYRASATLPIELRRHFLPELEKQFNEVPPHPEHIRKRIERWSKIIRFHPRLVGIDFTIRDQLAYEIARIEAIHPDLIGTLDPFDFESVGDRFIFSPGNIRAEKLQQILGDQIADPFPEFKIDPTLPENDLIDPVQQFLTAFRAAERLFDRGSEYDFGKVCAHCNESALRTSRAFRAKGFESFVVETLRYSSQRKLFDYEFGQILKKLIKGTIINLNGAKRTIERIILVKDGHDPSILQGIRMNPEDINLVHGRLQALDDFDRSVLMMGRDNWHRVAAVKLGKRYYLVDVNQQQFGSKYDQLVFIPAEVAIREGIHILNPIPPEKPESSFLLPSQIHNELKGIREYMIIQGSIAEQPSR